MKKITLFLCLFAMAMVVSAQSSTTMKGPKAKNSKPWIKNKADQADAIVLVSLDAPKLKGPAAKNKKAWKKKEGQVYQRVMVTNMPEDLRKGPRFKNRKPWKNASPVNSKIAVDVPRDKNKEVSSNTGQQ